MLPDHAILDATAATLNLLASISGVVKEAKKKESPLAVADILAQLPVAAYHLAGQFERQLADLRKDLLTAGVAMDKTLSELYSSKRFWRLKQYRVIQRANTQIHAITLQLSTFLDDVVAVAHCREAETQLAASFTAAKQQKEAIREITEDNASLDDVLKNMLDIAQDLRARLGEMANVRASGRPESRASHLPPVGLHSRRRKKR